MSQPIKFVHSSDFHAGAGRRLTPRSLEYLERSKWYWRQVIQTAVDEKAHFALIAGDMFENSSTTIEELLALYQVLTEFGGVCPVIVTPGNHDETSVGEFQQSYLKLLEIPNVRVTLSTPESFEVVPGVKVLACPWTGIKKQQDFNEYLESYYKGEQIVMLHECFKGITTDVGWRATSGITVPDIVGVKYFACGDIHKYQKLNLEHAWYSGAPGPWTFGDKPGKGCIVVEIHDLEYDWRPRFVKFKGGIELINITSLDQIPENSPHWYKLSVDAAHVPSYIPPCVKDLQIMPAKIDTPASMSKSETAEQRVLSVDYCDGVNELLTQAGYSEEEIALVTEDLQKVSQGTNEGGMYG